MAWQRVAKLSEIPESGLFRTEANGTGILIIRDGEKLFVTSPRCTHEDDDLSSGILERGVLVCSFHSASFDPSTGAVVSPPEGGGDIGPLKTYGVKMEHDDVMVDC